MNTMYVEVLRGIPCSGKSFYANAIRLFYGDDAVKVISADHYFARNGDPTAGYMFEGDLLSEAHGMCLRRYTRLVSVHDPLIKRLIIDNTNTQNWEAAPYMALAQAHGAKVTLLEIRCPLELALERNAARGRQGKDIPVDAITRMHGRMMDQVTPYIWPCKNIDQDTVSALWEKVA